MPLDDGTTQSGAIEQVEFTNMAAPFRVHIVVSARLGAAMIPQKVLDERCSGQIPGLKIATVLLRYGFTFDGENVVADPNNPSTDPPRASYSTGAVP